MSHLSHKTITSIRRKEPNQVSNNLDDVDQSPNTDVKNMGAMHEEKNFGNSEDSFS